MHEHRFPSQPARRLPVAIVALCAGLLLCAGPAGAQIVLGHHYRPHYWDLPTDFKQSFTFPGQTALVSSSREAFDARGRKVDTGVRIDTDFGFTIVPRFFKFREDSNWAYAASLSTYEFRSRSSNGAGVSGVGSLIPSLTGWTKPTPNTTVGFDALLATPFSLSSRLDSHQWDLYLRGFVDANVNNWNLEAVVGYQNSFRQNRKAPALQDQYHFNLRAGYDIRRSAGNGSLRITPYASMDHQRDGSGSAWVTNLGGGVMFTHPGATIWSLGWSRSVDGKRMPVTDGLLAQFWIPL